MMVRPDPARGLLASFNNFPGNTPGAAERREEKIRDFHEFFKIALNEAEADPIKEIILIP